MTAFVTTKTDPLGLTDSTTSGSVAFLGAAFNNFWNDIPDRVAATSAASLNTVRLVDWLTSTANATNTYNDPAAWALVDSAIAQVAAAGLMVMLDLSTFRNWSAKKQNVNPYTLDWTTFVNFVANRVNTVSGLVYKNDPAIVIVSIAGEPSPGGEVDGNGVLMPTSSAQLVSFYGTVAALVHAAFPRKLVSSGGLLHYRAGSVGDTSWVDWQGVFSAVAAAAPGVSIAAVHVYSGVDFGGGAGTGDESQLPGVATYCTSHGIPWMIEEFGLVQNGGQGDWVKNDTLRAKRFTAIMALGYANGAIGVLFWNNGTELYFSSADVVGSAPVNLVGGTIPAWSSGGGTGPGGSYNKLDAVSRSGTNWWSMVANNATTPSDATSQQWGKLKASTFDVGPNTPLVFAAVRGFVPGALRQLRALFKKTVGGSGESVSILASEVLAVDELGVQYVDEDGVPYAIGA